MALTRKLARGGSSESAPISIANKEAAYALTGVAAGTVYKTEDTGQIMEFIGTDETSIYDWKMDGVIWVDDNDDKQLLTNLPDGQQVKIVGEGGRLERFNGDGDGLNQGDFKILVNHPDNPVIDNMEINGIYTYYPNSYYYQNDDGVVFGDYGDGTYVIFTGSLQWSAPINGLATPDLMSPWTAVGTAAQGYAAMTSDMITRQPAATESNWRTIKNTVYLTVAVHPFTYGLIFHGVSVSAGSTQGIGWVAVTEPLEQNSSGQFKVAGVNGDTSLTVAGDIQCITSGTQTILPDVFPSGALVTIDNS